ncbi:MAG TPA: circularly permuted type 2 ATP-grasp protein [Microlunatus sp.]|nr:circularly permuted type 2 ATP-grasp protein [Microlunatus sp.]
MTVLGRYLAAASRLDELDLPIDGSTRPGATGPVFDEFAAPDGSVRRGWVPLMGRLDEFAETSLVGAQREVARLLEDDGVTYIPSPMSSVSIADDDEVIATAPAQPLASARHWQLDPLPLVFDDREWASLEPALVQRTELLDAVLADVYGVQRLLSGRHVPASAVFDHPEYLRPMVGMDPAVRQPLFLVAVDLGRDADGHWKAISDRTQAPSGAGYAMANRRVVSRVMPDIYQAAHLHRLTPFFQTMRAAALNAAPRQAENPRVVVLSPGTHSETAFDQAFLASLLGFPLIEGSDLTVREGRVWMRVLDKLEQVDVILRRVDSEWCDPLELRAGSRLGVAGLAQCVRRGTVSVINPLGSGLLENPALMPLLPDLCQRLLGEDLRLPSVDTWWCGDPASLSHVINHIDHLVVRPVSRGHGRSVRGAALTADQKERLIARVTAAPHRFVGQEVLPLSAAPTSLQDRLVRRSVVLRAFTVRSADSYAAMFGGLGRVSPDENTSTGVLVTAPDGGVAKDVWVVSATPIEQRRPVQRLRQIGEPILTHAAPPSAAMVPRVLSDLYWFGRYAERAEDLLRLILATRTVALETDLDVTQGRALQVLLQAITHVSTAYPGFLDPAVTMMPELRAMLLERHRTGTAAQAIGSLSRAAQGVRDQLSEDVWMVLADIDRALGALSANPYDQGLQLTDAAERVLSGLLALAGIVSENMVRDPGWYMLDSGRGLERALQVLALLRVTVCAERDADTERLVMEAVLTASESIVTFRRRYRGQTGIAPLTELLVLDQFNPRSVAYQLVRVLADLEAMPGSAGAAAIDQGIEIRHRLAEVDLAELAVASGGRRVALEEFLADLQSRLRELSESIRRSYQQPPPPQQTMWQSWTSEAST